MLLIRYVEDDKFIKVDTTREKLEKRISDIMECDDWCYLDLGFEVYELNNIELVSIDKVEI